MRDFSELTQEMNVIRFLGTDRGTLCLEAGLRPTKLVRHFDGKLPTSLIPSYLQLLEACQAWVERRPEVSRLARFEQPLEVGADFVMRPFHIYITSIQTYDEAEDPPEAPAELATLRALLRAELARSTDSKQKLVEQVLSRSILEPCGKTFFRGVEDRFVVVEPRFTAADVTAWSAR
ncbi:MAG TPA: hypothetical protein VNG33_16010 [Polyangiaceae bacterium]|nr:hypothetical protein [Polyangiaceae bacterium]